MVSLHGLPTPLSMSIPASLWLFLLQWQPAMELAATVNHTASVFHMCRCMLVPLSQASLHEVGKEPQNS